MSDVYNPWVAAAKCKYCNKKRCKEYANDSTLLVLVLVVDERGRFSAVDAHIFPSFIKTVLEDVD